MARLGAWFKRLHPVYKGLIGLVAPIGTIIATLLALNVIQPTGEDALAASVDRFAEAETAAVALHVVSEPDGAKATEFDATGEFDYRSGYGRFRYDFSATGGGSELDSVEVRFRRRHAYMRLGGDRRRPWIHADLATAHAQVEDYARAAGLGAPPPGLASLAQLDFNDPSQVLSKLRDASEVRELGGQRIYGVAARRYQAVIEPREHGSPRLTATAWIDGSELIRRLDLTTDDGRAPFRMTMAFTDFGKAVNVRVPPHVHTKELEDVLAQLLE